MIKFSILGSTKLQRKDGRYDQSLLKGPKRLALFTYLLLARTRGFKRRDKLIALFWPERGQKSARNALSNLLYHIRAALGDDVVINRGTEEVGINYKKIWCDVSAFEEALSEGKKQKAMDLYRGDLLPGFHVADASNEFNSWLDGERARLRRSAADTAWLLAEEAEQEGRLDAAKRWAKKAVSYSEFSEESYHRLITLLHRLGDRPGVLKAYDEFETFIREEWEMEPSEKLKRLVEDINKADQQESSKSASSETDQHTDSTVVKVPDSKREESPFHSALRPVATAAEKNQEHRQYGWWAAAAGLLILVITAGWIFWPDATDDAAPVVTERSVAVLPFTYLGAEDSTDYFSLGMTEEILTRLAQISDLSVISRTSVMQYRNTDKSLRQIASELGVAGIVEGSVQQQGGHVRIHAQLIDAKTDHHLWSKSYNRELKDILAVQSEVATRIAEALQVELLPQERVQLTARRDVDEAAYHLYLQAQHLRDWRDPAGVARAETLFHQAIRYDSTFAPAYAGLAMASVWLGIISGLNAEVVGVKGVAPEKAGPEALQAARRALAIDSTVVEAYLAKALVYELFEQDWERSEQAFKKALQLNPSHSEAREEYGWQLLRLGRIDTALVQMRQAVEVDPLSWDAHHSLGYAYYCNRQYQEAIRELETALNLGSKDPITKKFLNIALLMQSRQLFRQNRVKEVETYLKRSDEILTEIYGPNVDREKLFRYAVRGQRAELLGHIDKNILSSTNKFYAIMLAGWQNLDISTNEKNFVADYLNQNSIFNFRVHADPIFDSVRNDLWFRQIVEHELGRTMESI